MGPQRRCCNREGVGGGGRAPFPMETAEPGRIWRAGASETESWLAPSSFSHCGPLRPSLGGREGGSCSVRLSLCSSFSLPQPLPSFHFLSPAPPSPPRCPSLPPPFPGSCLSFLLPFSSTSPHLSVSSSPEGDTSSPQTDKARSRSSIKPSPAPVWDTGVQRPRSELSRKSE